MTITIPPQAIAKLLVRMEMAAETEALIREQCGHNTALADLLVRRALEDIRNYGRKVQ